MIGDDPEIFWEFGFLWTRKSHDQIILESWKIAYNVTFICNEMLEERGW